MMNGKENYSFHAVVPKETQLLKAHGGNGYQINDRYLLKNGEPWLPASGEIHYSRIHRDLWDTELDQMKAAGLTIISTYVFWIHHEEVENEFSWEGNLNLGEFIDLCHEKGLEVSLRIGPWAHGECRNGGFPDWILHKCGKEVRCNAEPYMTYVRKYYERIVAHLNGRRLFSIQIENELVFDNEHLERLYDLARECGFEANFFTATAWGFTMKHLYDKMLPTFGGYPEQPWNQDTGKSLPNPHFFFTGERNDCNIGNDLLPVTEVAEDESMPYLTCETGPGIQPYDHRRPVISAADALSMVMTTLGDGCNLLGLYMFHGGSNPVGRLSTMQESRETGYPNDCPVISYDFQAPIGESGYLRESWYRLQTVFSFLKAFGTRLAPMIPVYPDCRPSGLADTETLRCCMRSNGQEGFLFVNNHHHGIQLPEHRDVGIGVQFEDDSLELTLPVVPADATFLLPVRMKLSELVRLDYAFAQPVSIEGKDFYFEIVEGMEPLFCFADGTKQVIWDTAAVQDITIHVRHRILPQREEGTALQHQQAEEYQWTVNEVPKEAGKVRIHYYGDSISVCTGGRLIADQYYYGDFLQFYKPEGIDRFEIKIKPLLPEKDVYLECERRNGGDLEKVLFF